MVFSELLEVRHVHLDELDVLHSDEADVALQAFNDTAYELPVPEDVHAHESTVLVNSLVLTLLALQVAVVQDQVQQVDDVDLHRMVIRLDAPVKRLDERLHDQVSHFIGDSRLLVDLLQQQVHELTS